MTTPMPDRYRIHIKASYVRALMRTMAASERTESELHWVANMLGRWAADPGNEEPLPMAMPSETAERYGCDPLPYDAPSGVLSVRDQERLALLVAEWDEGHVLAREVGESGGLGVESAAAIVEIVRRCVPLQEPSE